MTRWLILIEEQRKLFRHFCGCIVPENVIGKDKDKTETSSRWAISFY
jgi:hypothetical protein